MGTEFNQDQTPGLPEVLASRLHTLLKQIDSLRFAATPNILLLESAEENLRLAVDAFLESELDEVETLLGLVVRDLQYV
ncbi:MAG TPA: hypothetical protein VEX68_29645 [Bryobacteraceae bacterium]|nr:hypothetical protein [Bryobacteraceae bacterium]